MRKIIFALSLLFVGMTACDNNEDPDNGKPNGNYPTISFSKIQLSEDSSIEGTPTVTTTQTYLYNQGRVTDFNTLQKYTVAGETTEMKSATTIVYDDNHQAIVTDEYGNVSTYTLNDKGYATKCIRQEVSTTRTYTFSYIINTEDKYYLKKITESTKEGEIYASIDVDYEIYRALRITQKVDTYEQKYTATTSPDNEIANLSEIPCLFLAELYPMSLHSAALYGKLLGEPFDTLITQIIPDGNAVNNEITHYSYKTNSNGIVTSCNETINSGGSDYYRTVKYVIE